MKRKRVSWILFCWFAGMAMLSAQSRPNILLILVDDLGKHDLSVYQESQVATPNLDRLAESGTRFSQAYATASICSPSRFGVLTGRYQQRFGFEFQPHQRYPRNILERWAAHFLLGRDGWKPAPGRRPSRKNARKSGLPAEATILAEYLKKQGYRTGAFGKWHLGYEPQHHPLNHGFDTFYGFPEAYSLYSRKRDPGVVNAPVSIFADKVQWKKRRGSRAIQKNGKEICENRYLTNAITAEALDFIREPSDTPFFAFLAYNAPHAPWQAPKAFYDSLVHIQDHHERVYFAMVAALDQSIGQLLGSLDAWQLRNNTLIVFASDNGVAAYNGHIDSGKLTGGKFSLFEGGINVPLFFSWPGNIAPGRVIETPVSLLDIAPTLLGSTGIDPVSSDGTNLLPFMHLQATKAPDPMRTLFWRSGYAYAVRQGPYKLILDKVHKQLACYHLGKDPQETRDIQHEEPDRVQHLLRALENWEKEVLPPAWPHAIDYEVMIRGKKYYFAI